MQRLFLAALAASCSIAHAAPTLSISPLGPTNSDSILLQVDGVAHAFCFPRGPYLMPGQVLRVELNCASDAPPAVPPRIPLGQLPIGIYQVELVPDRSGNSPVAPLATMQFTVYEDGFNSQRDFGGVWSTNVDREGVSIAMARGTAFVTFMYFDTDGTPAWVVMPAAFLNTTPRGYDYDGAVWKFQSLPDGTRTGQQVGRGKLTFSGFAEHLDDGATMRLEIPFLVERTLKRVRLP